MSCDSSEELIALCQIATLLYAIAHDYSSISSVRLFDPNSLIEITHERTNEPEKNRVCLICGVCMSIPQNAKISPNPSVIIV